MNWYWSIHHLDLVQLSQNTIIVIITIENGTLINSAGGMLHQESLFRDDIQNATSSSVRLEIYNDNGMMKWNSFIEHKIIHLTEIFHKTDNEYNDGQWRTFSIDVNEDISEGEWGNLELKQYAAEFDNLIVCYP